MSFFDKVGNAISGAFSGWAASGGNPIGAAVGAGLGLMSGGGDSKSYGSQTVVRMPAPWESDMKQLWDEFLDRWYGTPTEQTQGGESSQESGTSKQQRSSRGLAYDANNPDAPPKPFEPNHVYIRNTDDGKIYDVGPEYTTQQIVQYGVPEAKQPDIVVAKKISNPYLSAHGENWVLLGTGRDLGAGSEGRGGAGATTSTKSFLDMLRQNEAEKKAAEEAFVNAEQGITDEARKRTLAATNRYNQLTRPMILSVGGISAPWVPRNALAAAGQGYKTNIGTSAILQALAEAQAQREKNLAQTYTTNAADINYLTNYLMPMARWTQALRYGIPTTQTEAELPGQSFLSRLGQAIGLGREGYELYKGITGNYGGASLSNIANSSAWDSYINAMPFMG